MSSPDSALPRLIVVTNDDIVARAEFFQQATSIMEAGGARVAMQLRAQSLSARALCALAEGLAGVAEATGALLFVNERIDVALAVAASGVQLGISAVPLAVARALAVRAHAGGEGADGRLMIGASVHTTVEAERAEADGADLLVLGTIWASATHPGRQGSGPELVRDATARVNVPVYAIGGVTPARAREVLDAGGYGVAVITRIWDAADQTAAALSFLEAIQVRS